MVETGASSTDRLRPGLMSAWGQARTSGDGYSMSALSLESGHGWTRYE